MSTAQEEEVMEPEALLLTCDSLLQLVSAVKDSTSTVSINLQTELLAFRGLLRSLALSEENVRTLTILRGHKKVLESLQDCIRDYEERRADAGTDPKTFQEEQKSFFLKQRRAILECRNELSLAWPPETSSPSKLKDAARVQSLRHGFDRISKDLIVEADDIFLPSSEDAGRETFTVREREVPSCVEIVNTEEAAIVCPNAAFLHEDVIGAKSKTLKFGCFCRLPGVSHDEQLEYQMFDERLFLVEKLRLDGKRSWEMFLLKPRMRVVLALTELSPAGVRKIRKLSQILYLQANKNLSSGIKSLLALVTSDCLLVLDSWLDSRLNTSNMPSIYSQSSRLDWEPQFIGLFHYAEAPKVALQDQTGSYAGKLRLQSYARLVIGKSSFTEEKFESDDMSTVAMYKDATIRQRKDFPLEVELCGVELITDQARHGCDLVFKFCRPKDAAHFAAQLGAMRQRLLQTYAQGPFSDENEVYFQDSDTLTQGVDNAPQTDISVILSKRETQKPRLIAKREGSTGVLCLDFDFGQKAWQIDKKSLQASQDLIRFYFFDYDNWGIPNVVPTNWDKVRTQRKARQGPRSGGAQVTSDLSVKSDDWLDGIGDLRAAMKAHHSTEGGSRPVKVCVIDTGFRADDKGSKKVARFKDFVNPNNMQLCDKTWHGTQSATIVLSIYECCELYVARVFDKNDADEERAPELMAMAIEWAMEPEQDVDIINISAGFRKHSSRLQEAVQKASGGNKLIIAAAGNWANLSPIAFPARNHFCTMCIFSTNVHGQSSQFNPKSRLSSHNFALLGEDWQHRGETNKREQGTSMATAAASGLAAMILDFSRQAENKDIERVSDVGNLMGMTAIFNIMAEKITGGLDRVDPMKLLPSNYENMPTENVRKQIKSRLWVAMEKAN